MDFSKYNLNDLTYEQAEYAVRKAATEEFDAQKPTGENDRNQRERSRQYVTAQVEAWFRTQADNCSVVVFRSEDRDEIRDIYYGGSITVYGPKRQPDWQASREQDKQVYKIVPGQINASSWTAGCGDSESSVFHTTRELKHRMRMMQIALDLLNKRNELCLEWDAVESPWHLADECKRRREEDKTRFAQEQAAKEAKARKAKR
jgi:hypothetical protein